MNEDAPNQISHKDTTISSLITGFRCIRQYYFGKTKKRDNSGRYTICKLISSAEQDIFDEEELWKKALLIDPDIDPGTRSHIHEYVSVIKHTPLRPWTDLDLIIRSERTGISGLLDKFDARTGEATLVRCTKAPVNGCWAEDRIRAVALILCIEETFKIRLKSVSVEYIPSGIIRYYEPGQRDRRVMLQVLRKVHEVDKGIFPEKPPNPPCEKCIYSDKCNMERPKTLLQIFKKSK